LGEKELGLGNEVLRSVEKELGLDEDNQTRFFMIIIHHGFVWAYGYQNSVFLCVVNCFRNEPWHKECFVCQNCGCQLAGQKFASR
jgi:LIM domain